MHVPTLPWPQRAGRAKDSALPAAAAKQKTLPWWAGVAFYVVVTAVGRLVSGNPGKNRAFYAKKQEQAPWAPPGAVFGIAWSVINVFVVRALIRLLSKPSHDAQDRQLLGLQGAIWLIFGTFGYVYFRKRSPLLCAVWTVADAAAATASYTIARKKDPKLARNYLPLLAWTWYASTVAAYQAWKNSDPVLGIR